MFGIGSALKDAFRKAVPNELAEVAVKAAPFVAPFNPAIAAAMAGLGSFDQTGRVGSSIKSAGKTYLGGQALRGIGGAGFQTGFGGTPGGGIGSYFTSPFTGQATFGPERGSFFRGEGSILGDLPTDAGTEAASQVAEGTFNTGTIQNPDGSTDIFYREGDPRIGSKLPGASSAGAGVGTETAGRFKFIENFKKAEGIGEKLKVVNDFMTDPKNKFIVSALGGTAAAVLQYLENQGAEKQRSDFALFRDRPTDFYNLQYKGGQQAKDGGIIGLANGGEPAMEMDYRGGGFIPVGAKERADDVPARLSKNEFVMTADAVRAAGGGSVDVGAQKMYDLMNKLEAQA
tara:strand:+ start:17 stop:1048 length:1032 start_codon:yes stop_codon:yes gene_type:complete